MKGWMIASGLLWSVMTVAAPLPQTVEEVDIQIEYLEQQKILMKKRYQGDAVYHHRALTRPAPNMGTREQENRYQAYKGDHLSWLMQGHSSIDQEIAQLKKHKQTLQQQSGKPIVTSPAQVLSETISTTKVEPAVQPSDHYVVAILVPANKVSRQGNQSFVVINDNGQLQRRQVSLGQKIGSFVQITSGLQLGETVMSPNQTDPTASPSVN